MMPIGLKIIGHNAFENCTGLSNIEIPGNVKTIGYNAFSGCINLISVDVKDDNLFYKSINGVLFNKAATSLIQYMIGNSRTSYSIPCSVISICDEAFKDCEKITYIEIPSSVKSVGKYAFVGCKSLTNIALPSSICTIEEGSFSGCTALTNITIPSSVSSIGNNSFNGCTSLISMTLPFVGGGASTNTHFGYIFGARDYKNNNNYIPSSLETIIITPTNHIADYAFYDCANISNITITSNITTIGIYAFSGCKHLINITIPDSIKIINKGAFNNCLDLIKINILAKKCPILGENPFNNTSLNLKVFVPEKSLNAYKNEECWRSYTNKIFAL